MIVANLLSTIENVQDAFTTSVVGGSSMKKGETDAFSFAVGKKDFSDISFDSIPYGEESGNIFGFTFPNMTGENIDLPGMQEVTIQVTECE